MYKNVHGAYCKEKDYATKTQERSVTSFFRREMQYLLCLQHTNSQKHEKHNSREQKKTQKKLFYLFTP